jgi:hypothetical protein
VGKERDIQGKNRDVEGAIAIMTEHAYLVEKEGWPRTLCLCMEMVSARDQLEYV